MGTSMGEYCGIEEILEGFKHEKLHVKWLNSPIHSNKNLEYNYIAVSLLYLNLYSY